MLGVLLLPLILVHHSWSALHVARFVCAHRVASCCHRLKVHETWKHVLHTCTAPQDIITKCWVADPAARPSFEKVLDLLKDAAKALAPPA